MLPYTEMTLGTTTMASCILYARTVMDFGGFSDFLEGELAAGLP